MRHSEAQRTLLKKGMVFLRFSLLERREYWGYTDFNTLLDHSATITWTGRENFEISDFSTSTPIYPFRDWMKDTFDEE